MSLCTDKFFFKSLKEDEDVMDAVDGRIINTADTTVDPESADDTEIPYIIITNEGTVNDEESKDSVGESDTDTDTISIVIAAKTRSELADVAKLVRKTIKAAFADMDDETAESLGFWLNDYSFTASGVNFDEWKPCMWQTLNYKCETTEYNE